MSSSWHSSRLTRRFSLDTGRPGATSLQPSSLTNGGVRAELIFFDSISTDRRFGSHVGLQRGAPDRHSYTDLCSLGKHFKLRSLECLARDHRRFYLDPPRSFPCGQLPLISFAIATTDHVDGKPLRRKCSKGYEIPAAVLQKKFRSLRYASAREGLCSVTWDGPIFLLPRSKGITTFSLWIRIGTGGNGRGSICRTSILWMQGGRLPAAHAL